MRRTRIALFAALAAGSWLAAAAPLTATPQPQDADRDKAQAAPSPDPLAAALDARIAGKASLDDVRIDTTWFRDGRGSSARVFGDGVVVCDAKLQTRVPKAEVVVLLKALRKARFGAMPDHFGEGEEGEEDEKKDKDADKDKNEGPRLKGRIHLRIGALSKGVLQLVDGEQSEELEALSAKILGVCRGAAKAGTGADSIADGLQKISSGALAPEVLEMTLQRRVKPSGQSAGEVWILTLEGRRVADSLLPPGRMPPPTRRLVLKEAEFQALVKLLADSHVGEIPINVYTADYTDLNLTLLNRSRFITGRKFLQMTPETHGEKQKAFDAIDAALADLHARIQKEGKPDRATPPASAAAKESAEKEREREREKEKEREREKEERKPSVTPGRP